MGGSALFGTKLRGVPSDPEKWLICQPLRGHNRCGREVGLYVRVSGYDAPDQLFDLERDRVTEVMAHREILWCPVRAGKYRLPVYHRVPSGLRHCWPGGPNSDKHLRDRNLSRKPFQRPFSHRLLDGHELDSAS